MRSNTHISSSVALALIPFTIKPELITTVEIVPGYLVGVIIGSLFPDIDEPKSAIGIVVSKYLPFVPFLIKLIFGHRGITHQFLFFLIPLLVFFFTQSNAHYITQVFSYGFLFGIFFHQLGDMLSGGPITKGGIKDYFYPLTRSGKYITIFPRVMRCVVWDFKEKIYNLIFIGLAIYQLKIIFWGTDLWLIKILKSIFS